MTDALLPLRFLLLVFAGLVNREQAKVVDYLREENRVLREQLGKRRLRDSTNVKDVLRVMDGEKAALVATDPPYLVDYTGERPIDSGKDWTDKYRENHFAPGLGARKPPAVAPIPRNPPAAPRQRRPHSPTDPLPSSPRWPAPAAPRPPTASCPPPRPR